MEGKKENRKVLFVDCHIGNVAGGLEKMSLLGFEGIGVTKVKEALSLVRKEEEIFCVFLSFRKLKEGGEKIIRECEENNIPLIILKFHRRGIRIFFPYPGGDGQLLKGENLSGQGPETWEKIRAIAMGKHFM